jgi:Txe/YoeB family toxin of Txe-Axe toxin-antitoxin module
METLGDKIKPKNSQNSAFKYYCKYCDYRTCKKSNYTTHMLSAKHSKVTNDYTMGQNSAEIQPKFSQQSTKEKFICSCGKEYYHRQGLWRHKKNCIIVSDSKSDYGSDSDSESEKDPSDKDLIMMLIKQNTELLEIVKNGTHNTTNSHNKTFNLNMFLNETCKNAMNINEFVDSLQLQMSDLENVGESGYIEGISSIIIKKLNTLDITERPIHCTDKKRETMYIKDENKWEKEDEKKTKMHKLVTKVANKNINMISEFQKLHPEWKKCSSKYADQHNKIVIESMGGKGDNEYEKQEKIIKKIAKEVFVDK